MKASRRDIAYATSLKKHAATTVASTMILAHLAGIKVFATGGIGGVHRGYETTMDVSADLIELGRTPVTVVCAGIKSILDIPRSLEFLETQGVPVIGYKSESFPAFFTNNSGIQSPLVINNVNDIANIIYQTNLLKLNHGIVVGVPNPEPASSEIIQFAIDEALKQAELQNIKGSAVTPFLLSYIERFTKGKSLDSNISLVMNNALIATQIAVELSKLESNTLFTLQSNTSNDYISIPTKITPISTQTEKKIVNAFGSKVVIIGGAVIDTIGSIKENTIMHSSNPGNVNISFGGVGHNIAARLSNNTDITMITSVGNDENGRSIINHFTKLGIDITKIHIDNDNKNNTASYTAIHDHNGELIIGLADMKVFQLITSNYLQTMKNSIRISDLIICDGNIEIESFHTLAKLCQTYSIPLFFEPTSDHKCVLPILAKSLHHVSYLL